MKTRHLAGRLLLTALASLPFHVQHAHATSGSASISGLKFELIDLDAEDGIAPTLAWSAPYANLYASSASGSQIVWLGDGVWDFEIPTQLEPVNVDVVDGWLSTRQVLSGGTASRVDTDGIGTSFTTAANGGQGSGSVALAGAFVLTPNTTLKVSGVFDLSVRGPSSAGLSLPDGASPDYATRFAQGMAYASVGLNPVEGGTDRTVASGDAASVDEQNYTPSTNAALNTLSFNEAVVGRGFSLTLINDAAGSLQGQFFASVVTSGQQGASAVPEPSTLGFAAAGLAVLGALRRRRASV